MEAEIEHFCKLPFCFTCPPPFQNASFNYRCFCSSSVAFCKSDWRQHACFMTVLLWEMQFSFIGSSTCPQKNFLEIWMLSQQGRPLYIIYLFFLVVCRSGWVKFGLSTDFPPLCCKPKEQFCVAQQLASNAINTSWPTSKYSFLCMQEQHSVWALGWLRWGFKQDHMVKTSRTNPISSPVT